jgi:hypothetical protein
MRRSLSILFLFLTSLNSIGYYGLLWIAEREQRAEIAQKIGENINEISGNLILKIPKTAARVLTQQTELEFDGDVYHVVRQQLRADTFYIVLLQDHRGTEVRKMMTEYALAFSAESHQRGDMLKIVLQAKDFVYGTILDISPPEHTQAISPFTNNGVDYFHPVIADVFRPPQAGGQGSFA